MSGNLTDESKVLDQGPIDRSALSSLSRREEQVLSLAAAGFLDKQIGIELGLSLNTLRTYWTRIRSKVGEGSRSALAVAYVEQISKDEDSGPDWEVELETGIWRKLSDRIMPIPAQIGQTIPLEEIFTDFFHPDDLPGLRTLIADLGNNTTTAFTYSARYCAPDGSVRTTGAFIRVIRNQEGEPLKLLGRHAPIFDVRAEMDISGDTVSHDGWICDVQSGMALASDTVNRTHGFECGVPHHRLEYGKPYFPEDYAKGMAILDEIGEGKYETGSYSLRTLASGGAEELVIVVHAVRDPDGKVKKVIGYRSGLRKRLIDEPPAPKVRIGFWAKNLRSRAFIIPDEEFCRIYRVDRKSPTLDLDIRSRYRGSDVEQAYAFIDEAVSTGCDRGSHDFTLYFEDGSKQTITLEFFVEHDEDGPSRINGTVLALGSP